MPSYDPDRDGGTNNRATLRRLNDKIVIHPVTDRCAGSGLLRLFRMLCLFCLLWGGVACVAGLSGVWSRSVAQGRRALPISQLA
jgi:hypothetical protein